MNHPPGHETRCLVPETGRVTAPAAMSFRCGAASGVICEFTADSVRVRSRDRLGTPAPPLHIEWQAEALPWSVDLTAVTRGKGAEWVLHIASHHAAVWRDILAVVRKHQHLELCLTQDVEASDRHTGFDELELSVTTLPSQNVTKACLETSFLGRRFPLPLMITGMTGGILAGKKLNLRLGAAAARFGLPMGVGSQRMALDNPDFSAMFQVKKTFPQLFLIGNIGFSQLQGSPQQAVDTCRRCVEMIGADALAIHLNVLQELVQPEGERVFGGFLQALAAISEAVGVPVLVKEVGSGLDLSTAALLVQAGIQGLDVGGRGGTAWGYIEALRQPAQAQVGAIFRDWGLPTAYALAAVCRQRFGVSVVATGGVRSGLAAAKALALGADMVGIGLPLLRAALESQDAVDGVLAARIEELRIAVIASGAGNLARLRGRVMTRQAQRARFASDVAAAAAEESWGGN